MEKSLWIMVLSLVLAMTWGGEIFAQNKKEMTSSETYYLVRNAENLSPRFNPVNHPIGTHWGKDEGP